MAISSDVLNQQLVAYEVHTGVYQNWHRRTAIVVKVKASVVWYLTLTEGCRIELRQSTLDAFKREWMYELYRYPVLRAVRSYARWVRNDGFAITDEARKVINSILAR